MPEQLLDNARQRSKNRTAWRQDLRKPARHDDHTSTHLHCREYSSHDATQVELWSAVGRELQLVTDQQMVAPNHPDLGGSEAMGWAWQDPALLDSDPNTYPYQAIPIADINLSAFTTIGDVMKKSSGCPEKKPKLSTKPRTTAPHRTSWPN